MAYRNMNKIICGRFNVNNFCPKNLSNNNADICSFMRQNHNSTPIPEAKSLHLPVVQHLKCSMYKKRLRSYHKLHLSALAFGENVVRKNSHGRFYSTNASNAEDLRNIKPKLGQRRLSEGNVTLKNRSMGVFALRSQYKSDTNISSSQRTGGEDMFNRTVRLKFNPNMQTFPDMKLSAKGLKHQFHSPTKVEHVNFKDDLLSMEDNDQVKKRLGILNTKVKPANLLGVERPQESVNSRVGNKSPQIPTLPLNSQPFSSYVPEKSNKLSSEKSQKSTQRQHNSKKQGGIKLGAAPVSQAIPKGPPNRAAKKILSRNFYTRNRFSPAPFRLKRDLMSPDVNEMERRHFFIKKWSYRTNKSLDFHKFNLTSLDNVNNQRESKLSAVN